MDDVLCVTFPGQELVVGRFSKRHPEHPFYLRLQRGPSGGTMTIATGNLHEDEVRLLCQGLERSYGNCARINDPTGLLIEMQAADMQGLIVRTMMEALQLASDVFAIVKDGDVELFGTADDLDRAYQFVRDGLVSVPEVDVRKTSLPERLAQQFRATFTT